MKKVWDPGIDISCSLAERLVARQFPELGPLTVESMGAGWDNAAFLVNGRLVFRFPRRQIAARLIEREAKYLPAIAGALPVPISSAEFVGAPEPEFPRVFAGYSLIVGTTACRAALSSRDRFQLARPIAAFLRSLHGIHVEDPAKGVVPGDEIDRTNLPGRLPAVLERLRGLRGRTAADVGYLLKRAVELTETPRHAGPPCWVHGDLYARHIVVGPQGGLAGVIDWGDLHAGDPALDLSLAYTFFAGEQREEFWNEYGTVDEAARRRAQFRAIHYGAVLAEYGRDIHDEALMAAAEHALLCASE